MNLEKQVYTMTILLASASPRRAALLEGLGLRFTACPTDFDEESIQESSPARLVLALSAAKAALCAQNHPDDSLILAADTIVIYKGMVLGKPADEEAACSILSTLSDQWHEVYSGVTLQRGTQIEQFYERTEVRFRALSEAEIEAYVQTGEPMDKAGAYGIQGLGALFVSELKGDYYTVMGLPLCRLGLALRNFGLDLVPTTAKQA